MSDTAIECGPLRGYTVAAARIIIGVDWDEVIGLTIGLVMVGELKLSI